MSLEGNIAVKVELDAVLEFMDQLDAEPSDFESKWEKLRKRITDDRKSADGGWL